MSNEPTIEDMEQEIQVLLWEFDWKTCSQERGVKYITALLAKVTTYWQIKTNLVTFMNKKNRKNK